MEAVGKSYGGKAKDEDDVMLLLPAPALPDDGRSRREAGGVGVGKQASPFLCNNKWVVLALARDYKPSFPFFFPRLTLQFTLSSSPPSFFTSFSSSSAASTDSR